MPVKRSEPKGVLKKSAFSVSLIILTVTFLLIVALVIISIIGPGFDVETKTIANLSTGKITSAQSNERIVIQEIKIINNYFLPRAYELPRLKGCLYDPAGKQKGTSIGLSYGESVKKSSPFPLGRMATAESYGRMYYQDSSTASERVEVAPGDSKTVQLLLTPRYYYYDSYGGGSNTENYEEVLLIDVTNKDADYNFCESIGDETREKAVKINLVEGAFDSSFYCFNTGTLVNGPAWVTGKYGSALSFDGTDDYVRMASFNEPVGSFSVAYWFMPNVNISNNWISSGDHKLLAGFGGNPGAEGIDAMGDILPTGVIRAYLWTGSAFPDVSTAKSNWIANQWYHLAITYNSSAKTLRIYVNGQLDNSGTGTSNPNLGTTNLYIGGNAPYRANYFNGIIDEVKIYSRALTADEIYREYSGTPTATTTIQNQTNATTIPASSLAAHYKFDEGSGTITAVSLDDDNKCA